MNRLNDEQMDRIIKEKFQKDNVISDKANSIFANLNPQTGDKSRIKKENTNINKDIMNAVFYKKLNKFLSVAAVSLTVVLVGGTTLYFNQDKLRNNSNNPDETTIIYTRSNLIQNEQMHFSNEQVVKEVENDYAKVYLVGKRDIGVQFKSIYWSEVLGSETVTSEAYKIDGINDNVKDIFLGNAVNSAVPYIFLLMEDGTVMYVDLQGNYANYNTFYFIAVKIDGLYDVVGFEEKTRKFSYSNTEYTYVNAIRNDGKRKEIEIGEVNNWDDTSTKTFDRYNEKYVNAHNGEAISDDGKGDFEVDGTQYYTTNRDSKYMYCLRSKFTGYNLYRIERSTGKETCIASGIGGMARDNKDGKISFYVIENDYIIYELDENIIYRDNSNNTVINEVTNLKEKLENQQENNEPNIQDLSEFEKKVYESGDYYYCKSGHYCIKNPRSSGVAYYIENTNLYRVITPDNDRVICAATAVEDIEYDGNFYLIVTAQPNCSKLDSCEGNVIFKEYSVTDSPVVETYQNENIQIILKEDGSLTAKVLEGGLKRLGFETGETTINEEMEYNMFGSAHGVEDKKTHLFYADAKRGILAEAGKNGRLCFVYEKGDGYVIGIDILNAIECGSFSGAMTSQYYIEGKIEKLYISEVNDDKDDAGNAIPKYNAVFVLKKDQNGKETSQHIYMPCEDIE